MTNQNALPTRIASIDIIRALTMTLMLFVNDLWSLTNIPNWLKHAPANHDGMWLSDIVFPAFLLIVGLSIPHAIENRRRKQEKEWKILLHIGARSLALIIMGLFLVNFESINSREMILSREVWEIIMFFGFFLVWAKYPSDNKVKGIPVWILQVLGVGVLIFLAAIYKGGWREVSWMKIHWWGILGLIGWSYLLSALVYFFSKGRIWFLAIAVLIFMGLNLQEFLLPYGKSVRIIVSASNYNLVMMGVLTSAIYRKMRTTDTSWQKFFYVVVAIGVASLVYGFLVRPLGGISKVFATPSFTMICSGITLLVFAALFVLADVYKHTSWANIIAPAGRSTLTAYIVPYLVYPLLTILHFKFPAALSTGTLGLIKSILFTFLLIFITRGFEKMKVTLKI